MCLYRVNIVAMEGMHSDSLSGGTTGPVGESIEFKDRVDHRR